MLHRLMRRFAPELHRHRALVAGSFTAIFAEVLLRLAEPWPLALVLDHVLGLATETSATGRGPLAGVASRDLLWIAPLLLVAVAVLRALASYSATVGFALTGNRLLTAVRNELYRRLQALSLSFHANAKQGDLVLRVIGDVGMVREVVVTAMLPLLGNVLILAGMLAVMTVMDWRLTLIGLTTVPLFWLSMTRLGRRIRTVSKEQRRREGGLATRAAETLGAIQTVQAMSLDEAFASDFVSQGEKSLKQGVKAKRLSAQLERTVDVLNALATALVLGVGASIALRGQLTPGELVVFITYLKSAFRPVRNFAKYSARIAKASAAAERVLEVLEQEPEVTDRPDAREAPPLRGAVRFEAASFGYGDGPLVLRDVDFSIEPGEHVAVVGASGAGKSTLVGAILRLHDPRTGSVSIDGLDLKSLTLASLRGQISVVLQESLLFAASVRENIAFGAPDAEPAEIEAAARAANAHGFITQLPQGYETQVGERGQDLSVGQRQRIAIARAFVGHTPIVILDEPLAALDAANAGEVAEALARLTNGRTTFLITHDIAHAAGCDRILSIEHGRVSALQDRSDAVAG